MRSTYSFLPSSQSRSSQGLVSNYIMLITFVIDIVLHFGLDFVMH